MTRFIERHPLWALTILIAVAAMLWLFFAESAAIEVGAFLPGLQKRML